LSSKSVLKEEKVVENSAELRPADFPASPSLGTVQQRGQRTGAGLGDPGRGPREVTRGGSAASVAAPGGAQRGPGDRTPRPRPAPRPHLRHLRAARGVCACAPGSGSGTRVKGLGAPGAGDEGDEGARGQGLGTWAHRSIWGTAAWMREGAPGGPGTAAIGDLAKTRSSVRPRPGRL
jgi:hypothetical protein